MLILVAVPGLVVVAAVWLAVHLSRNQVAHRPIWVVVAYALCVAVAVAFAFLVRDEFGFSIIPAMAIAAPWYFMPAFRSALRMENIGLALAVGTMVNGAILYLIARSLVYAEYSKQIAAQPVPAEELTDTP